MTALTTTEIEAWATAGQLGTIVSQLNNSAPVISLLIDKLYSEGIITSADLLAIITSSGGITELPDP